MRLVDMPVCKPEEAGIPSEAILRLVRELCASRVAMHDVIIVRHGRICFEAYWEPFDRNFRHRLYSVSKSFVAIAVGILIDQGLLSYDAKAISFFPDKAPATPHPWLAEMTIRDLLRMATCYQEGTCFTADDPDWGDTMFTAEISHKPGQVYAYCTTGTTMLCMIIRRVCGKEFMEILRPAFDALGISRDAFCVQTPCGYEWGGSGVCLTAREFAAFADLCTHYGEYHGQQLLPRQYMLEATSIQIDNNTQADIRDTSYGYGYQIRVMREGFLMRGMGGQFAMCFPEYDLTFISNAYDELYKTAMEQIPALVFQLLIPYLSDRPLPPNDRAFRELRALSQGLKLPMPVGKPASAAMEKLSGKTFRMEENKLGWRWLRFEFQEGEGVLTYENVRGEHTLRFGLRGYIRQSFPETHYSGRRIGHPLGRGYDCLTAGAWATEDSLSLYCQIIDIHQGNLRLSFGFGGDSVTVFGKKHAEWFLDDYVGFATGYLERGN